MSLKKLSVLVIGSAILSACGSGPVDYAKLATRELGVPVTLNTDVNDVCAERQLRSLVDAYLGLTLDEKKAVKRAVSVYSGINVQPTVQTARISGEVVRLLYRYCSYRGSQGGCMTYSYLTKNLSSSQAVDGTPPVTQVEKSEDLTITPQSAFDSTVRTDYLTTNEKVFKSVESLDDPSFKSGLEFGLIEDRGEANASLINCGKLVTLPELL